MHRISELRKIRGATRMGSRALFKFIIASVPSTLRQGTVSQCRTHEDADPEANAALRPVHRERRVIRAAA